MDSFCYYLSFFLSWHWSPNGEKWYAFTYWCYCKFMPLNFKWIPGLYNRPLFPGYRIVHSGISKIFPLFSKTQLLAFLIFVSSLIQKWKFPRFFFLFFVFFFAAPVVFRILVPQPRIELLSPAVETDSQPPDSQGIPNVLSLQTLWNYKITHITPHLFPHF